MREALQTVQALIGQALDLLFALGDFLGTSAVSLPVPAFVGVSIVTFLMGLILGRISKKGGSEALESSHQGRNDRVVLDLETLTPLGVSAEEEAEATVMDISHLRTGETAGEAMPDEVGGARHPGIASQH
jgi:hypothetical protein